MKSTYFLPRLWAVYPAQYSENCFKVVWLRTNNLTVPVADLTTTEHALASMNANWFSFEISSSEHVPYTSYLYDTPLQPQPPPPPPFRLCQFLPASVSRCNTLFWTIRKALCITSLFSRCSKKWSQSLSDLFVLYYFSTSISLPLSISSGYFSDTILKWDTALILVTTPFLRKNIRMIIRSSIPMSFLSIYIYIYILL
jgi:hypothetical protein